MEPINFIPILLSSLGLTYAAFKTTKKNKLWLCVAFVIWVSVFALTFFVKI